MAVKVLFVMMAYNTDKYIEKAVMSVLNQTEKDIILIVRNNGSTDRTGAILDELAKRDERLLIIHNKINGQDENGKTFYEKSWWTGDYNIDSEYVSIIDSDDYLANDFVEKSYKKAVDNDADIVATGSYFVDEDYNVIKKRTLIELITDNMSDIDKDYKSIYNCFRTWWGKLFKSDFFWSNYTEAWAPEPPMNRFIDTIIMFRYIMKCKKLVTFNDNLYYMLVRRASTYNSRPFDFMVHEDAFALYNSNMRFLMQFNIANRQNVSFVQTLHWSYLVEALESEVYNKNTDNNYKFTVLQRLYRDLVSRNYLETKTDLMLSSLYQFVTKVLNNNENFYDNKFWAVRLKKYIDMEKDDSCVNFLILLGCMTDLENSHKFARILIKEYNGVVSKGVKKLLGHHDICWHEFLYKPHNIINLSNNVDRTDEVIALENELIDAWNKGDYETACELINVISDKCLFSFVAIYYRIRLALLIEDYEFAGLLYYTARSIWNDSPELSELDNLAKECNIL